MKLDLAVYVPAIGQNELLNSVLRELWDHSTHDPDLTASFVIDNASKEPIKTRYAEVIRNEENLGMVGSLQQAVEHSNAEILVYMHSDMYIYENGWDSKLVDAFRDDPKLGALGVVGAPSADANGGRGGTICAFRNGEIHGAKPTQFITPAALLDGCFVAYRRAFLENIDWESFEDNGYYFYDKDISLTLTMQSRHVGVVNFDCDHLGGQTSCRPEFNETLVARKENHDFIYARSENRYLEKWKAVLPVKVRSDWHVDVGVKS